MALPRGTSFWTFLECLGPRFNATRFDEDSFPDGARRTVGMFDKSQIDLEELVRQMAGGRELAELQHELAVLRADAS